MVHCIQKARDYQSRGSPYGNLVIITVLYYLGNTILYRVWQSKLDTIHVTSKNKNTAWGQPRHNMSWLICLGYWNVSGSLWLVSWCDVERIGWVQCLHIVVPAWSPHSGRLGPWRFPGTRGPSFSAFSFSFSTSDYIWWTIWTWIPLNVT